MHTIRDILNRKPPKIVMIDPQCTMLQTLLKMAEHGVGALLVADSEGNLGGNCDRTRYLERCGEIR